MKPFLAILFIALIIAIVVIWQNWRRLKRATYIRHFSFPVGLYRALQKEHPGLSFKDCQLVGTALRQFFLSYHAGGLKPVSMPSQVVDDLWHAFILYTKDYQHFCKNAFGTFMHHTPAVVMGSEQKANSGLRRCFYYACRDENINPNKPLRLPLLFAIDAKLNIPNGFVYVPDCKGIRRNDDGHVGGGVIYCGGDFAHGSSGVGEGFSDITGSSSGGDFGGGDGDGGGGCSGGCGS